MKAFVEPLSGRLMIIPSATGGSTTSAAVSAAAEIFDATAAQTNFPLTFQPLSSTEIVTLNGLREPNTEYTIGALMLQFNDGDGIWDGDLVEISYLY